MLATVLSVCLVILSWVQVVPATYCFDFGRFRTGWYCTFGCCYSNFDCCLPASYYWYAWVIIVLVFLVCLCVCAGAGGYGYRRRRYVVTRQPTVPLATTTVVTANTGAYQPAQPAPYSSGYTPYAPPTNAPPPYSPGQEKPPAY